MGAAPIIGAVAGAASTVSQISAQRRAAASQREQIQAAALSATRNYELNRRRFDYARSTSAQMYLRERAILDAQAEQARNEFTMQQVQTEQSNIAQRQAEMTQSAEINSAMRNLLSQATTLRGNAALQNAGTLNTLANVAQQNDPRSQAVGLTASGQNPSAMLELMGQASLLDTVAQLQNALESTNTIDRVSNAQASSLESNAQQLGNYRDLISQFYDRQRTIQGDYQGAVDRLMPGILDLQAQRNQVGLEAERFAREADANIGAQAAAINYNNQQRVANAQLGAVQGPNVFGALGSLAQSVAAPIGTFVAQQNSNQQQGGLRILEGWNSFPTGNSFQPGSSVAPYRPRANGVTFPTILDVPQEIPVYG